MPLNMAHKLTEDVPVQKTMASVLSIHTFLQGPACILGSVCRKEDVISRGFEN